MKTIFEPAVLGNLSIGNRVVRSATLEIGHGHDGVVAPELADMYADLVKGGVGLIITGMMGIGKNSCVRADMARIYHESYVERFGRVVDTVHGLGGKVVVQLGQCGAKAGFIDEGDFAYAPSDFELGGQKAKAMTAEQIAGVVRDFGAAALRCKEAGADGVQMHGAHGYLMSQFLSPHFNKRTDEYGGPIENRARIVFAVYDEIRRQVGAAYPVMIKINSTDLVDDGMTEDESAWVCGELSKRGIDAIEISGGIGVSPASAAARIGGTQGYFAEAALRVAGEIDTAVISVGGYRTPEYIETVLNKGKIQAISLCRPLIKEPAMVKQWRDSRTYGGSCISCNKCYSVTKHGCAIA